MLIIACSSQQGMESAIVSLELDQAIAWSSQQGMESAMSLELDQAIAWSSQQSMESAVVSLQLRPERIGRQDPMRAFVGLELVEDVAVWHAGEPVWLVQSTDNRRENAGVSAGDRIVAVNGWEGACRMIALDWQWQVMRAYRQRKGRDVKVLVWRAARNLNPASRGGARPQQHASSSSGATGAAASSERIDGDEGDLNVAAPSRNPESRRRRRNRQGRFKHVAATSHNPGVVYQ